MLQAQLIEPPPLTSIQKQSPAFSWIPLELRLSKMKDIYYRSQSTSNPEKDNF